MASNNNASEGAKQNNVGIQFSLVKKIYNMFNGIPYALRAPIATLLGSSSINDSIDLWICAYELVQKREANLMENYMKHLDMFYVKGPLEPERDLLSVSYAGFIVKQLINIREKDKIRIPLPTVNTEMEEQIERLAKFLTGSDDVVKAALKTQPHAALAWSSVSIFLLLLRDARVYNKAMLQAFNALSDRQIYWKACEKMYLTSSKSQLYYNLRDHLAELYSFIIEYQARIICHITKPPVSRTLKAVTRSEDWTEMIQPIQNLENNCLSHIAEGQKAEIYLNSESQLEAVQKQVVIQEEILQDLKSNKQDDMERKLLGDLAAASGDYARYKNINPERVPGTCEWFLADDRFCKWRDSQTGALLWVSAGPGCGKSVLSRCLMDEGYLTPGSVITIESSVIKTSRRPSVICYFFFKEGGEGQMDSAHALCAILHQLFQHPFTSNLITYALPSHKSHEKSLTQKMEVLWQILVDCVEFSSADIVCVLDALDECRGDSAQQLLRMVEKLYSQHDKRLAPSKLKFLITSRPYDDLKWSFDRLLSIATYLHFDGDEKSGQIGEEINLVIDVKVQHIAGPFSEEARDKISKRLKSMENRTYLWLHLTLDIIEKQRSAYSRSADIEKFLCELPSQVADAYEKILSRSQDERKVEALLQIVLAATRPLTLDEANNALALAVEEGGFSAYAILKERLWSPIIFKTTVQNLCGLFIRIHDSKLSFIHQTAREFLVSREQTGTWKGRLSLSKSHGILSGACINYLQVLDPSCRFPITEYPLFSYAASNWFLHFSSQDADCTEMLRKPARELCRISSPQAQSWFRRSGLDDDLDDESEDYEDFDWTDLHLVAAFGLAAVAHDVIVHEHADVNEMGRFGIAPLRLAIVGGHLQVMEVLLDPAHGARIFNDDIESAAGHDSNAEAMTTLLLDKLDERDCEIQITERVLKVAGENRNCGAAVLALLLNRRGDKVKITQSVVKRVAQLGSTETMSLLLHERGSEFKITEDVMKCVVKYNKRDMLALLLERPGQKVKITEAVLIEAMGTENSETLDLLIGHSNGIKITEKVVQAAAKNCHEPQIIQLLLDRRGRDIPVTGDIVKAAASNSHGPEAISLLLDRYGHEFSITEDVIKAAVANWGSNVLKTVSVLLDRRGHEFTITEDIVKIAVANWKEEGIVSLLLDRRGDEIHITEDIVKIAVANINHAEGIMCLLLTKRGHEFIITEDIIKAAVASWSVNILETISLLLNKRGHEFTITEDMIKTAVASSKAKGIMPLLLDRRGHEFTITEDIFKAAVANRSRDVLRTVSLLLDKRGDEINITEDVFKAAVANNGNDVLEMISLLFDKRGDEINITEDIFKAAVANNGNDVLRMVSLLLDKRGDEINITEDVFKAAVGNPHHGLEMATLLLDRYGHEINITEDVFKAAVAKDGSDVLRIVSLLLDKCEDEINITEDIFKAVVGNPHHGLEIATLLLNRRGGEIIITKDIATVA